MCDVAHARNIARKLKRAGFGKNIHVRAFYLAKFATIDIDDLTQICLIACWKSKNQNVNFYRVLVDELAKMGIYRNRRNETPRFNVKTWHNETQIRQLYCLYSVLGFSLFYEVLKPAAPRSTVQKWCWKAFAKRKDETRPSKATKNQIKNILAAGGWIRFSKTSASVYIENNEEKIRISDHEAGSNKDFTNNLITN